MTANWPKRMTQIQTEKIYINCERTAPVGKWSKLYFRYFANRILRTETLWANQKLRKAPPADVLSAAGLAGCWSWGACCFALDRQTSYFPRKVNRNRRQKRGARRPIYCLLWNQRFFSKRQTLNVESQSQTTEEAVDTPLYPAVVRRRGGMVGRRNRRTAILCLPA